MASSVSYRRAIPTGAQITNWHAADGWSLRRFDWPAARGRSRGSILFEGGRGDIFEKYLEVFSHWHASGWSITSLDWRGQGGSGRTTENPHVGHIADFAQYIGDIGNFFSDWAKLSGQPRVVMGHSMGGHLVLRAMVEGVIRPDAAVLIAPMLGLNAPISPWVGAQLAQFMGRVGDDRRPAWKTNERPHTTTTREDLLTHDHARYTDELWWQDTKPELMLGPPSWRWVIEGFRSTRALQDNPALRSMYVPVLTLVAEADKLVDAKAALATAGKLPDSRLVRFGSESAHEILREVDGVRDRAIAEIDRFLNDRTPPR